VLLRLSCLALTNVFAFVRLLPVSDVDKDVEILALRHQLAVLQRQIDKPRLAPADRAFLGALLHRLPRPTRLLPPRNVGATRPSRSSPAPILPDDLRQALDATNRPNEWRADMSQLGAGRSNVCSNRANAPLLVGWLTWAG
jgi:hypothetical protein